MSCVYKSVDISMSSVSMSCCLAPDAFEEGHSLDRGWISLGSLSHSSKGVCVFMSVSNLDHARFKQEVAHIDWAGPEVLQRMNVVCDSVLLCVGSVGRCAHCWLGSIHN